MKKFALYFLIVGLTLMSYPAQAVLSAAEEFYLDNGLQVVVVPNHKAPIVKHIVLYKAGRIDEPQGKGGIAHLLEHLMFRGTHKFKDGEFNRLIEQNGGESNAGTGHDYTYYHQFISLDRLELAMYLEADRMTGLSFDEKTFAKEREVVYQERQERLNNSPARDFWEQVNELFWQGDLHGKPIGGTAEEIKNITGQDILDFYQKFYTPDNAILILSGDIDTETARQLAQKYYGKISPRRIVGETETSKQSPFGNRHQKYNVSVERDDLKFGRLAALYRLPRYTSDNPLLYANIILADYLGGSVTAPLYKKLRLEERLSSSQAASFDFLSRGDSTFSFYAQMNQKQNNQKIRRIFFKTLEETKHKLTDRDLQKVKKRLLSGLIYDNDNPATAAEIVVSWLGSGYTLADIKNYEDKINRVTRSQVKQALEELQRTNPFWAEALPMTEENH